MSKVFHRTGNIRPGKSVFNLSYSKKLTCDMGQLIPIACDEVVPGDVLDIGNEVVIRMQPLVAPILHPISVSIHWFFYPNRLAWNNSETDSWEAFITGGEDGTLTPTQPTWSPTPTTGNAKYTLWDYFGFPLGIVPLGALPVDYPRIMYNQIYNDYYRDENLTSKVALTNEDVLLRAYEKDYFCSALPWQQRGVAPSLPISGTTSAVWDAAQFVQAAPVGTANIVAENNDAVTNNLFINNANARQNVEDTFNENTVDLSSATTFNVADLRLAFQIQKWMERNARAGARYCEYLKAHYGTSPRDERLQRPEYIGGMKCPVIISEVLQTSEDGATPQGNMSGHGISVDRQRIGKYRVQEFGFIMGIMSIMPKTLYQQGINRQFLHRTKYDYYTPEFANLSEQAIEQAEIYTTGVQSENETIFGYQGRYDEMRVKQSMVVSDMRDIFDYWHISRQFSSAPTLNTSFIECDPRKDIFAVPSDHGFIVSVGNLIRAVRPMPVMANPGFIDH